LIETSAGSTGFIDERRRSDATRSAALRAYPDQAAEATSGRRRRAAVEPALTATVARDAGRMAASKVTDDEFEALLERHRALARKKVTGAISVPESLELQLVRWELDRIEDARSGPARDLLWEAVEPRRELADEITKLVDQLKSKGIVPGRERGRRR
jgi:hypothetical protein